MQDATRDPLQLFQSVQVKVEQEVACTPPAKKRNMATEDEAAYKSAASSPCTAQYEAAATEAMKATQAAIQAAFHGGGSSSNKPLG